MKTTPIKRSKLLQSLSGEHHHVLFLCWKITTGLKKSVSIERIKAYTDWFYIKYLIKHFEVEEDIVFPILGKSHPLIKKATLGHKRLISLFEDKKDTEKSLSLIAEELEKQVLFEERILFNEIEQVASDKEIEYIVEIHKDPIVKEKWKDEFWK